MLDLVLAVLFFPLALFLPGYLVVSGFTKSSASQVDNESCDCPFGTIEALFLSLVLSVSLSGVLALFLALLRRRKFT